VRPNKGRSSRGRFTKGNSGGPGNPYAKKVAGLRSALLSAVTQEDMKAIARVLVEQAKSGDIAAVRELLMRVLGRPLEADILDRLDRLDKFANDMEAEQKQRGNRPWI